GMPGERPRIEFFVARQGWVRHAGELLQLTRVTPLATQRSDRLEVALQNDRMIVLAALAGIAAVAWGYMLHEAHGMQRTGVCQCLGMAVSGPDTRPWAVAAIAPLFFMWAEMMVAMMI